MPKGASKDITTKLNAAVQVAMADPKLRARIAELGQQAFPKDQQAPVALATLRSLRKHVGHQIARPEATSCPFGFEFLARTVRKQRRQFIRSKRRAVVLEYEF
jgi:hypothetical protein